LPDLTVIYLIQAVAADVSTWIVGPDRSVNRVYTPTDKILNTTQPPYLYDLVSIQPPHGHNKRSSSYVTLIKPSSSLKVTYQSFRHVSSLEPASYITQNSSSELLIPLSATII